MRQSPDITGTDEDSYIVLLDRLQGPYFAMRRQLKEIGFGVLPHPYLGFGSPETETRATEALAKYVRDRVSRQLHT